MYLPALYADQHGVPLSQIGAISTAVQILDSSGKFCLVFAFVTETSPRYGIMLFGQGRRRHYAVAKPTFFVNPKPTLYEPEAN